MLSSSSSSMGQVARTVAECAHLESFIGIREGVCQVRLSGRNRELERFANPMRMAHRKKGAAVKRPLQEARG